MIKYFLIAVICFFTISYTHGKNGETTIPAFEIKSNDLELSRTAQPNQYFDKIGMRAGLMGCENGTFETWVWPWKPLKNFELQFLLGTSTQPVLAKDIVRTISVTPEITTLTYTYESFTLNEHILVPRDEPGVIILLDVHTTTNLTVVPGFIPVMQPMWPAGIGGQFSYWEEEMHGYVISEAQWRAIVLCGSPAGEQMAAPPAHMFGDNPLQFKIEVRPGESDGKFIPIVITGSVPDTNDWKMSIDSVKETYKRLWRDAEKYYRENYEYYRDLRNSTLQIVTPDKEIDLAFEWGKVALDNLMIKNPRLGYGMVAGFGLSGGGARPGFAWYFGGDAFINILTLNSVGMFRQSRDALAFTQKWQREDNFPVRKRNPDDPPADLGKMAHELSQSDGICDWWNDYRYGYNHADTSPWYIVAMGDYVRTSGDLGFLKESWKSVKRAYEWCLSKDSDGDGLMDLKGAGLGALEFGKLVGIYADVYTCGVFLQAVGEMKYMSGIMGDSVLMGGADSHFKKAKSRMEKLFWLEKERFYAYGTTEKGEQVREKTPWSGVAMMFGLLNDERSRESIESFNSADLCTDWGVRSLSDKSELFEPTNYNYGAVWPFISSFFNTAQFRHNYSLSGYQLLKSTVRHAFDNALGVVSEVFSGELNTKLGEAYHHQGFSTTGYMLPLLRGLLGLSVDAFGGIVKCDLRTPDDWDSVSLKHIRVGKESFDFQVDQTDSTSRLSLSSADTAVIKIAFSRHLPQGLNATDDDSRGREKLEIQEGESNRNSPALFYLAGDGDILKIRFSEYPAILPPPVVVKPGMKNRGLKVISSKIVDHYGEQDRGIVREISLTVEGLSGESFFLPVKNSTRILSVNGAETSDGNLNIRFDKNITQNFIRKEIVLKFK